jgi:preprotein translocase subunit SecY
VDLARRKIKVSYAKQIKGRKMYGGQSQDMELKVNASGVMPIIFASSLLAFPHAIIQLAGSNSEFAQWWSINLGVGSITYTIVSALLIFAFTFFWAPFVFDPDQVAKELQERGGMVANHRPGKPTADYLRTINRRITLFGALFLGVLYLVTTLVFSFIGTGSLINALTCAGMLIIVSVAIDFNNKLEEQMLIRNYKGFLKK